VLPAQGTPKFIGPPVIIVRIPPFLGVVPVGAAAVVVAAATEVAGTACSVGRAVVVGAVVFGAADVVGAAADVAGAAVVGAVVVVPLQETSVNDSTIRTTIATHRYLPFILDSLLHNFDPILIPPA